MKILTYLDVEDVIGVPGVVFLEIAFIVAFAFPGVVIVGVTGKVSIWVLGKVFFWNSCESMFTIIT